MIEQVLYEHLKAHQELAGYLTKYNGEPAVFNQKAAADNDELWDRGTQYGRVVFAVDLQGDPERIMGGTLAVDIMCKEENQDPDEIEPVLRSAIHGYFFTNGTFVAAAQWKNSAFFTEETDQIAGYTVTFDLLAFPVITTTEPDVVRRLNEWTKANFEGLYVINHDTLPETAWKPTDGESAIYWRKLQDTPADWIPDTFHTVWRTATIKGHVFSCDAATAAEVARNVTIKLHAVRRLTKKGESQIMTNRRNTVDQGADPLRTGQITVDATYGVVVYLEPDGILEHINY